jgi:hypothetical protein
MDPVFVSQIQWYYIRVRVTHHFYKDGVMLEADIYVAFRK